MSTTALLVSVRPEHAKNIFEGGRKTAELRRTKPRVKAGDMLFVYVSSPVKALVGICEVTRVIAAAPRQLWKEVWTISGVTQEQFNEYYEGADCGFAIVFKNAWSLPQPLELACLRQEWGGFTPPQIYRYLSHQEVTRVRFILETQTGECVEPMDAFSNELSLFSIKEEM